MNKSLLAFVQLALEAAASLPPAEKADHFEVAAELLQESHPAIALRAKSTASAIREAEAAQLYFRQTLNAETL